MGKQAKFLPVLILLTIFLVGCGLIKPAESIISDPIQSVGPIFENPPTEDFSSQGLSNAEMSSLSTLQKIDDYPLYTMKYFGEYQSAGLHWQYQMITKKSLSISWGCSLFAALADPDQMLFGRNFDWEYSPGLVLFTDPPDGFASVSMVDIAFLGYDERDARMLASQSLPKLKALMYAPELPFDGLNERGVAIGMAAVPSGDVSNNPGKSTIGSIGIMRKVLDHASNVSDAISIMKEYNIDFEGGPNIHYLIADREGKAVLVEYTQAGMHILPNMDPWHLATNYLLSSAGDMRSGKCSRYDRMERSLDGFGGNLTLMGAMDLLKDVSQELTQWSVVYNLSTGEVQVVMGQSYNEVHEFQLEMGD